jgi:hypothetical protein
MKDVMDDRIFFYEILEKNWKDSVGRIQIGCWQLSGQTQSAKLETVDWANAWIVQKRGMQYVTKNRLP